MKQHAPFKSFPFYLLKFGVAFCIFYFGTLAVIGLSAPDNNFSPFVADHLDFIAPLRTSLLWGAKAGLSAMGHSSYLRDDYTLALADGNSVRMVYSCIGYGVMSFWAAFVIANNGSFVRKTSWVLGGWAALWTTNVGRLVLLLLAAKNGWVMPLGWDHHTWFNIAAYTVILGMIYFYDRFAEKPNLQEEHFTANQNTQAIS